MGAAFNVLVVLLNADARFGGNGAAALRGRGLAAAPCLARDSVADAAGRSVSAAAAAAALRTAATSIADAAAAAVEGAAAGSTWHNLHRFKNV